MKERFRRIGAVILALCLLLTTLNLGVLAEDAAVEADAPDAAPLSGADDALDSAPQIEYSASGYSGAYDGAAHAITVNVATAGCSVRYAYPVGSAYGTNNPTFTVPGTYTVGYLITAPSYPDVEGSATVTITEGTIHYSVDGFVVEYDGRPHFIQLDVATEGISVRYAVDDGAYSAVNPGITDVGQYVVYYILEKQYYASEEGSVTVEITKIDISDEIRAGLPASFTYSGDPVHFDLPYDKIKEWSVIYWNGDGGTWDAPSAPGSYIVEISGEGEMYCANVRHSFSIVETLPQIEYTAGGYNDMYDGAAHSIDLSVTTPGVSVSYATSKDGAYSATLPSFTEPGAYTVWFKLEKVGYETVTGSATVTIAELGKIEYTVSDYSGYYDGAAHSIAVSVATEGVAVSHASSENGAYSADKPSFTEPGAYTVWFKLEKVGYETVTGSATVTIAELGKIEYTVSDYSGYYDGAAHSIAVSVATEGVAVSHASSENGAYSADKPSFTEPGAYTVWFKLEKAGYATVIDSATVTIMELSQIAYDVQGYSGYYDGEAHTISLHVSTPDATVTYATSEGGEYSAAKPSFSGVGTHTIWYRIEKEHYETVEGSEVVKLRQPKEDSIVYSVEDYVGAYDGEAHTIALDVTTPDVRASYATSEKGAYGATLPTFTEPGMYTVWFRLEKSGFETSTGSATVTIEKAEQILYFEQRPILVNPSQVYIFYVLPGLGLKHDQGDGALSWSSSDPSRIFVENDDIINGKVTFSASYEEWSKGYSPTITVTAAETDHYKAATATCTVMASSSVKYYYLFYTGNDSQNQEMLLSTNLDLTILPVTEQDGNLLSSVSNALRKKLMASAGSSQIGAMAVNAVLTDTQTGEELHSTNGDLTLSFTGSLGQSYQMNYKNMACVAVHIKQNSTNAVPTDEGYDFTMPTGDVTVNSSFAHMPHSTPAPQDTTSDGAGASAGSSGFTMSGGTIDTSGANSDGSGVYAGSLSPTVEFIPCKLTKSGVVIKDTSLSPFLLIYGPKEAFSKLLTVRAKDGVFTYDGEGHAVAAEPSIAEGTTLYYSLDLESWQTDAPAFTDVLWNEDGSVGSYQVYVLADNPDCDPAVCSYSVTILPAQ